MIYYPPQEKEKLYLSNKNKSKNDPECYKQLSGMRTSALQEITPIQERNLEKKRLQDFKNGRIPLSNDRRHPETQEYLRMN